MFYYFAVSQKDTLLHELYAILEKLHYPEIAQISYEQFETTILIKEGERIDLLHWLLSESPLVNSTSLSKSKDNCSRSDKILKYYSHMGLCSEEKILLGQCSIDDQLQFLTLLINFIKAVHLPENTLQKSDITTKNKLEIDYFDSNLENNSILDNEARTESNCKEKLNNISKFLSNETVNDNGNVKDKDWNIKESIEILKELRTENSDLVLQTFNKCFEKIIALSTNTLQDNSESCYDIDTDLQQIHSAFIPIDKSLISETKVKNQPVPEIYITKVKPLTQAIKSNLVLIEQVHNMFNKYEVND